jgi:hypothetical protein
MKLHRISRVEALRHPVVRVTFDDGLAGELDLTDEIATQPLFAPLRDEALFQAVAVDETGRSFGWNVREPGEEIDLCADAVRIHCETRIVEALADGYARRRSAAE